MAKKGDERKKDYGKAYNRYLKLMEKNEEKGYIVSRYDFPSFIEAYQTAHNQAVRAHDAKRSVIRVVARQSVEFTNREQDKILKRFEIEEADLPEEQRTKRSDLRTMDRQELFDKLLEASDKNYETARIQYNSIFNT